MNRLTSEPVPAVVGIATWGRARYRYRLGNLVIADPASVRHQEADGLRRVDGAPASEADQTVVFAFDKRAHTLVNSP
ncbi:MAG: hypothetical protein WA869_24875, partial [Alloacidobacterium sp.]